LQRLTDAKTQLGQLNARDCQFRDRFRGKSDVHVAVPSVLGAMLMINRPGSVITSILWPVVKPHCSSHLPVRVSCGGGLGLPPLGR